MKLYKVVKKNIPVEAYQTKKPIDIRTLEGVMHANAGDWIVTGVEGEQWPVKKEIFEWAKIISTALVLSFVITLFVKPTLVSGESMHPTLENGDYLLINRIEPKLSGIEKGDIVVFKSNLIQDDGKTRKDLVKRVIATEGDHIKIENSKVYVNDKLIEEPYIDDDIMTETIDATVPKGKMFVMGDNRDNSLDSRNEMVGFVDEKEVIGKVFVRLFPFDKITLFK